MAGVHLLGLNDNVSNFGRLKMWAERGLIHIEDMTTGGYQSESVASVLRRMKGISDMLANSRHTLKTSGFMYSDEFEAHQKMLEEMTAVCQQAQQQGMPCDASARRELVRRRPKSVCIPKVMI
jgi:hypothetical protein